MTVTVRYRGPSDRRIITTAEFLAAGLAATTATWEKANGFELDFDDVTGAWLLSQGEFESGAPNQTYGGLLAGATKVLKHNWKTEGWTPWTKRTVSAEVGGLTTPTVSEDVILGTTKGRITGQPGNVAGNQRDWYLRHNTNMADSGIKSLWWGGSIFSSDADKATPQMGHVHRAVEVSPGVWRAYVVTNNIFGSLADRINQNIWQTSGVPGSEALTLGSNGGAYNAQRLNRQNFIRMVRRFDFLGTWINEFMVADSDCQGASGGDMVSVTDVTDATFNDAGPVALLNADRVTGIIQIVEPTTLSVTALKIEAGLITPAQHKRHWPYWVRSELRGTILSVKVWKYGTPEPDWHDTGGVIKRFDTSVAVPDQASTSTKPQGGTPAPNVAAAPTGPGLSGLVAAHLKNSAYMEYGDTEFYSL